MATELPVVYQQNRRPVGFPITFRLVGDRLTVDSTRKVDEVRLSAVETVRMVYEPRGYAGRAFRTTLTLRDGKTVSFSSITWRSMVDAQAQGPEYRAFLAALLAAVAQASPNARFVAGRPAPLWFATAALAGFSLVASAYFVWRAYRAGAGTSALLGLAVAGLGIWQLEPLVRLNKPRPFRPEAPPADLMP